MSRTTIRLGATASLATFLAVIIASQATIPWLDDSIILTDIYIGIPAISLLGCALFIPRALMSLFELAFGR
jgi:hypothetical protein